MAQGIAEESGLAYVAMLFLLLILLLLGLAFIYNVSVLTAATMARGTGKQAHYLAKAAANHAMWRLLNEPAFPLAEDKYYMHSLGNGRYGYKVRRHTDTTFATIATVGVVEENLVQQSYVLYVISGALPGSVIFLVYDTNTGTADKTPKYREFNDPGWSPQADTVAVGHRLVSWLELAGCLVRREFVLGTLDGANDIDLAVWDGTSWGNQMEFTTSANNSYKCFDIAYESQSGDALVFGRTSNASMPKYTLWDGTAWVHNPPINAIDTGLTQITRVMMASNPLTDEILIGIVDWWSDLVLFQWDGTTFTNLGTIETGLETYTRHMVDIVYEQQSGDAMIVWAVGGSNSCRYALWDGASLTAAADLPSFGGTALQVLAAADPTSDYVIVAGVDNGSDLNIAVWDGDTWVDSRELDTSVSLKDKQDFDVEWESSGDEALVAWRTSSDTQLRYYQWVKASPGGVPQAGPDLPGGVVTLQMLPMAETDEIILIACDASGTLLYSLWDGDGFASPSTLGTDISDPNTMSFDLALSTN